MPAITFPFYSERHVYLEDGTRVLIPGGTPMTVRPTILFETSRRTEDHTAFIPVGDGASELDRAAHGVTTDDRELIKLDHLIHDSSVGPLVFSSLMPPDVCWDLLFKTYGCDYIYEVTNGDDDLFIADIQCYQDGRDYRPLIISALGKFMHQTVVIREKHLIVRMRMQTLFDHDDRNREPAMIIEIPRLIPEIVYGHWLDENMKVFFRCSVWDLFLRHHYSNWSEGVCGEILLSNSDYGTPPPTTPVFLKKATPPA